MLLNDPAYVEAARVLAARIVAEGGADVKRRIAFCLSSCAPRRRRAADSGAAIPAESGPLPPAGTAAERLVRIGNARSVGVDVAELAAWTALANVLLNLYDDDLQGLKRREASITTYSFLPRRGPGRVKHAEASHREGRFCVSKLQPRCLWRGHGRSQGVGRHENPGRRRRAQDVQLPAQGTDRERVHRGRGLGGDEGLHQARSGQYDLIILDVMLPDAGRLVVMRGLRKAGMQTPVIFLTARDSVHDRVKGWIWARTTTWSNRSRFPSCWHACVAAAGAGPRGSPRRCAWAIWSWTSSLQGQRAGQPIGSDAQGILAGVAAGASAPARCFRGR